MCGSFVSYFVPKYDVRELGDNSPRRGLLGLAYFVFRNKSKVDTAVAPHLIIVGPTIYLLCEVADSFMISSVDWFFCLNRCPPLSGRQLCT